MGAHSSHTGTRGSIVPSWIIVYTVCAAWVGIDRDSSSGVSNMML